MNIIQAQNPFFEKYSTPHGTIPFEKIKTEHYEPAIREGINRHNAEIDAITNNPEAATAMPNALFTPIPTISTFIANPTSW